MTRLAVLLLAMVAVLTARAAEPATDYRVDLSARHAQEVMIEARFHQVTTPQLNVHLPVWRTGLYLVVDPAGTLSGLSATDGSGQALPIVQTAKSSWQVDRSAATDDEVVLAYRIYADSLSDRTRHVDADHAFLNPGTVFVYADGYRDAPLRLSLDLPEHWRAASGMDSDASGAFIAPDYDRLVDSPVEAGTFDLVRFEAAGMEVEFLIHGLWDGDAERLQRDIGAVVEAAAAVFDGDVPTERYLFLLHSGDGLGGGTEYFNSTVVHTDPAAFWDADRWRRFLNLMAHEFFHTWNVKRFRPADIARYDYLDENYTELLWVSEGLTSYYDELLPVRAGLVDVATYRKYLARTIDGVVDRPGYGQDTLARASFEAWTKGYHRGADRVADKPNRTVSFYAQGGLLGLVLDLELRAASNGQRSLDDLMKRLYRDFPLDSAGYTYADFRMRLAELGGADLAERLDGWVYGVTPLPLADVLKPVGWTLERATLDADDVQVSMGVSLTSAPPIRVRSVRLDGPAWQAGVNAGDELLALDGARIGASLDPLLRRSVPGDQVSLALFRDGRLRELDVVLVARTADFQLTAAESPSRAQRRLRRGWLGDHDED